MENLDIIAEIILRLLTTVGVAAVFAWLAIKVFGDREKKIIANSEAIEALEKHSAEHDKMLETRLTSGLSELRNEMGNNEREGLRRSAVTDQRIDTLRSHMSENYVHSSVHQRAYDELKKELADTRSEINGKLDTLIRGMLK